MAELYLIVGYMALIVLIATVAIYIFIRQYKREMRAKEAAKKKKLEAAAQEKN